MNQALNIYKLMSDETRLRILMLLYQDQLCVCQLSGILDAPQPRISKNLSKLRDLGLVEDHRQEKFVYYKLKKNHPLLNTNLDWIMENLRSFEVIAADRDKLASKDDYYNICNK